MTNANCDGYTSQTYNDRSDVELQKLSLHGISVIVCSQDEGTRNFYEFSKMKIK